jgi:hypothetical protein
MGLLTKTPIAKHEDYEQLYQELRRTMQDIVIAHASACYKHMTPEQMTAVQAEWARLIKGRNWAHFFMDDSVPVRPGPSWAQDENE